MSTIEINKIAGAVLGALLLLLGLSFVVELVRGHPEQHAPVFAVSAMAPAAVVADAEPAAAGGEAEAAPVDVAALVAAADATHGETVFRKCAACHSAAPDARHKIGPNLWGVAGAAKAGQPAFRYSAALQALGGVWNDAELDAFLAAPRQYVPATKMAFPGVRDAGDRAAVIAYMHTLTDSAASD